MPTTTANKNGATSVAAPTAPTTDLTSNHIISPNHLVAMCGKEPRWMAWKISHDASEKEPISPRTGEHASCNDPSTWTTYDDAAAFVAANGLHSMGFVLTDLAEFTHVAIVDFDHVGPAGAPPDDRVLRAVESLQDTYLERSASGEGFHAVVFGDVENTPGKKIPGGHPHQKVEVFASKKMFAVSLDVVEGFTAITTPDPAALRTVRDRAAAGTILNPPIIVTADTVKFTDVCNDEWARHGFDSRSAAVQSALVTLAYKYSFDADVMKEKFEATALCEAWEEKGKWSRLGDSEIEKAIEWARKHPVRAESPAVAVDEALLNSQWFHSADDFLLETLPPREVLVFDSGVSVMLRKSLNEVYAFGGVGKSLYSNGLISLLIHGKPWLRFTSPGGYRVALIDAELPKEELQERLKSTVGNTGGRLQLMSPEFLEGRFPTFSNPAYQEMLLQQLAVFQPDVVIIDSLTAAFGINTNDPDQTIGMNEFMRRLRFAGYCVIFVHHAGKSGQQRGRSDVEDHADVVIKLSGLNDAFAGEYRVRLEYEKKRQRGVLHDFCFEFNDGVWRELADELAGKIQQLLAKGKSYRAIATALDVSSKTIAKVKREMEQQQARWPKRDVEATGLEIDGEDLPLESEESAGKQSGRRKKNAQSDAGKRGKHRGKHPKSASDPHKHRGKRM
jgi:AAA domain